MHPNVLNYFRDKVALPHMLQLFEKTQIPDGACYIDNLELEFLDGRSCGVDSHVLASGLVYRAGRAERYTYDEYDVDFNYFFVAHKDCIFISDGRLRINDDMDEMELNTKIRNIENCKKLFSWLDVSSEISYEMSSIQYEKLKFLLDDQQKPSLNEHIQSAEARASDTTGKRTEFVR